MVLKHRPFKDFLIISHQVCQGPYNLHFDVSLFFLDAFLSACHNLRNQSDHLV